MNLASRQQLLFVYGSLKRGFSNHHLISGAAFVGECQTSRRYRLLVLGAYPALASGGEQAVQGELYLVDARRLPNLDDFEGEAYRRASVELADGRVAQAYLLVPGLVVCAVPAAQDCWL